MNCIFTALPFYWHLWYGMVWGDYWPSLSDLHQSQKQDWCTTVFKYWELGQYHHGSEGHTFLGHLSFPNCKQSQVCFEGHCGMELGAPNLDEGLQQAAYLCNMRQQKPFWWPAFFPGRPCLPTAGCDGCGNSGSLAAKEADQQHHSTDSCLWNSALAGLLCF